MTHPVACCPHCRAVDPPRRPGTGQAAPSRAPLTSEHARRPGRTAPWTKTPIRQGTADQNVSAVSSVSSRRETRKGASRAQPAFPCRPRRRTRTVTDLLSPWHEASSARRPMSPRSDDRVVPARRGSPVGRATATRNYHSGAAPGQAPALTSAVLTEVKSSLIVRRCGNIRKSPQEPAPFGCRPHQVFLQISLVRNQDRNESRPRTATQIRRISFVDTS